jgi:phage-related holin
MGATRVIERLLVLLLVVVLHAADELLLLTATLTRMSIL